MKKIGIFTIGLADLTQGGSGIINYLLCDELIKKGFQVKAFFRVSKDFIERHNNPKNLEELKNRGLAYEIVQEVPQKGRLVFGKKLFCQFNQYEVCRKFVKGLGDKINDFDAVISFDSGWAMALAGIDKPVFRLIEDPIQGRMAYGEITSFFNPIFWKRKIQFWSINSGLFFRWLKKKFGGKPVYIFSKHDGELYLKYGIDCRYFRTFTPKKEKRQKPVRQLGKLIALHIGALETTGSMNMIDYLADDLFPELAKLPFEIEIRFVGRAKEENIRALTEKKYPNIKIVFLGYVESLEKEINNADLFFSPMKYPIGVRTRVITALSYGLLVLTDKTVSLGAPELIDGRDVIYADNAEETRQALERAYNNPDWLDRIGENGRQAWEKLYRPEANISQILKKLGLSL